jgi:hypothetical protein
MNSIESAYKQFSTKRFPLPTEAEVAALEAKIKVRFPDDFRKFLLTYNGGYFRDPVITPTTEGCPEDALIFISGLRPSHPEAELGNEVDLAMFDDNDPPQLLPIGATPLGSLIVLDVVRDEDGFGNIYFKQAFGDCYYLADNIEHFFSLLREPTK